MRRKGWGWGAALLSALFPRAEARGDQFFWSRTQACNRGCIRQYNQETRADVQQASLELFHAVGVPETLAGDAQLQRKTFRGKRVVIKLAGLTVSNIGVQLRDNGVLSTSCQLAFNGETERALDGINVRLRLSAYTGPTTEIANRNQRTMIWESRHELWVPEGRDIVTSIVAPAATKPIHARPRIQNFGRRMTATRLNSNTTTYLTAEPTLQNYFDEVGLFHLTVERHTEK